MGQALLRRKKNAVSDVLNIESLPHGRNLRGKASENGVLVG